eukprot:g2659.t1
MDAQNQEYNIKCIELNEKASSYKVPTVILYDTDKTIKFGEDAQQTYVKGKEKNASYQGKLFSLYKYCFHPGGNLPRQEFCIANDKKTKKKLLEVVADTFAYLKRKFKDDIEDDKTKESDTFYRDDIIWVFTVPEIWNDSNKSFIRQAAVRAGMAKACDSENLIIASEPECAAVHMQSLQNQDILEKGSKFMVIDAGGGTTDVVAFQVASSRPRVLSPLASAWGVQIGGNFVNAFFTTFLKFCFGEETVQNATVAHFKARQKFEEWKRDPLRGSSLKIDLFGFGIRTEEDMSKVLSRANKNYVGTKSLTSSGKVMKIPYDFVRKHFMKPVLDDIVDALRHQTKQQNLKAAVERVILAGGFSESEILVERLQTICKEMGWKLCRAKNEERLAIVKGAVRYGMDPQIIPSRKSPFTYGIITSVEWDDQCHAGLEKYKFYSDELKEYRVRDAWKKFVTFGEEVGAFDKPYKLRVYPEKFGQHRVKIQLYRTSNENPVHLSEKDATRFHEKTLYIKMPKVSSAHGIKIDIAFLLDCTESMDYHILRAKDTIKKLADDASKKFPGADLRFAFVGYRDFEDDEVPSLDFVGVSAMSAFDAHVGNVRAEGGDDQCENVYGGLTKVLPKSKTKSAGATKDDDEDGLSWREDAHKKLVFHIADAPTHGKFFAPGMDGCFRDDCSKWDETGAKTRKVLARFCKENIDLIFVRINWTTDKMIETFNKLMTTVDSTKSIPTIDIEDPSGSLEKSAKKMPDEVTKKVSEEIASVVQKSKLSDYQKANEVEVSMFFGATEIIMTAKRVHDNEKVVTTFEF